MGVNSNKDSNHTIQNSNNSYNDRYSRNNDYDTNSNQNRNNSEETQNTNSNSSGDRMLENNFPYHNFSEYDVPKNFNTQESNSKINGCIFIAWFIASIILMMIIPSTGIMLALFGQMFFFIGMWVVKKSEGAVKIMLCLFPIVGAVCMIWGLILAFGSSSMKIKMQNIVVFLALLLFLSVGIGLIVLPRYFAKKKKDACTLSIQARIIDIKTSVIHDENGGQRVYAPCYEYIYNGISYIKQSDFYSNRTTVPDIGNYVTLLIAPDNPDNFYEIERETSSFILLTILGAFFIFISGTAIFSWILNFL